MSFRSVPKEVVRLFRAYSDTKSQAIENAVNEIETRASSFFFLLVFPVALLMWAGLLLTEVGPVDVYEAFGFVPVTVVFVISYFTFFLGSKLIFKPTLEEVNDDTSNFALFSACQRRELRALISAGLAVLHTAGYFLVLISKDPKLIDAFAGNAR